MGYNLVLPFDDDSPSFAQGFEAAMIYEAMKRGEPVDQTIHGVNIELLERMSAKMNYTCRIKEIGYGWYDFEANSLNNSK